MSRRRSVPEAILRPGWLARQIETTRKEVATWPESFKELRGINSEGRVMAKQIEFHLEASREDAEKILSAFREGKLPGVTNVEIPPPLKNVVVATDEKTMCQAIYVDGVLRDSEDTIYASDIESVIDGKPCWLSTILVELPEYMRWPDELEELKEYESDE